MDKLKDYFDSGFTENKNKSEVIKSDIKNIYKAKDLENLIDKIKADNKTKNNKIETEFYQKLKRYLISGYNINLYGVGKKNEIVEYWLDTYFNDSLVLYVDSNSYLKISNILIYIIEQIKKIKLFDEEFMYLKKIEKNRLNIENLFNQFINLMNILKKYKEYLVIYITDISGKNIKDKTSQLYLSKIFNISNVLGITTVENAYFPLLLTREIIKNYNFVYFCVNTFIPYDFSNIQDRGELFIEKNKNSYDSFKMVLLNLTEIQRELLILLLENLIDHNNWINKKKFFSISLEEMLINDENQLNDNLREAIDHKILFEKKNDKGYLGYVMPFDLNTMRKLLNEVKEEENTY